MKEFSNICNIKKKENSKYYMENTDNQRLKFIMNKLGFKTQASFAIALGLKSGTLSDILRGKKGVGVSSKIKRILENTYNVNIEWLETGEGDKFKSPEHEEEKPKQQENNNNNERIIELLERTISDKDAIIKEKQKIIEMLQQQIDILTGVANKSTG